MEAEGRLSGDFPAHFGLEKTVITLARFFSRCDDERAHYLARKKGERMQPPRRDERMDLTHDKRGRLRAFFLGQARGQSCSTLSGLFCFKIP